jgi:hypothetical protein
MRLEYKPKTIFDKIKKRFALIPIVVEDEWVWLEVYYSYTEEGYAGPETIRFNTYQAAADWLKNREEI